MMKSRAPRTGSPAAPDLTLRIEAVAFGGDGIARHEGKVYFVADALPEEEVRVRVEENKKNFARARVLERLQPARYAQPSPCPYADRCGGCQWLEVPYPHQLAWKKSFIAAALQRIAKVTVPDSLAVTPSPLLAGYRNRIRLKLRHHSEGHLTFGYYAKGSHDLVPIARCWIADEAINEVLAHLIKVRLPAPPQGALYELELQQLADGLVSACLLPAAGAKLRQAFEAACREHDYLAQHLVWPAVNDPPRLLEEDEGMRYLTFSGQFQQVNLGGNRSLRQWIQDRVLSLGVKRVLDLFCGSGNFSLPLLRAGLQVWGIEVAEQAIGCAAANVEANQLSGGLYAQAFAHEALQKFPELAAGIDLIIVDPPRKGMAEAVGDVLGLQPRHIIYISCDPNTLARDLKSLLDASYQIREVQAWDFFPHSYHVETVVHLTRDES